MEFSILVIAIVVLAVVIISMGVKSVPQSEEWTVERFGKFTGLLHPGLNLIVPFVDRIGSRISMRERVIDVPPQDVITKDNAMVRVDGVVFFQIIDSVKAAYEVAGLENAIINLTMTNVRTVLGEMDLDSLLSNREKINATLLGVIDEATNPWGVKVTRIEIKDITPARDLVESMARQMKAEREKRATILDAEAVREAAILEAEGQRQATILRAEADKEAKFREAEARERSAEAEAKATQMVSEAIAKGDIRAINYFVAQKYVASLKDMASADNSKVIFMPLESSSIIGALGGVAELAKEAFKK